MLYIPGINTVFGRQGANKSIAVSASAHYALMRLKQGREELLLMPRLNCLVRLSHDPEALALMGRIDPAWLEISMQLFSLRDEIAAAEERGSTKDSRKDPDHLPANSREYARILTRRLRIAATLVTEARFNTLRAYCVNDPVVMAALYAADVDFFIRSEKAEYPEGRRTVSIRPYAPLGDFANYILFSGFFEGEMFPMVHWGDLAYFASTIRPVLVSSWSPRTMAAQSVAHITQLIGGGADIGALVPLEIVNSDLSAIGGAFIIEARDATTTDDKTIMAGASAQFFALGGSEPRPAFSFGRTFGDSSHVAHLMPQVEYYRFRTDPLYEIDPNAIELGGLTQDVVDRMTHPFVDTNFTHTLMVGYAAYVSD